MIHIRRGWFETPSRLRRGGTLGAKLSSRDQGLTSYFFHFSFLVSFSLSLSISLFLVVTRSPRQRDLFLSPFHAELSVFDPDLASNFAAIQAIPWRASEQKFGIGSCRSESQPRLCS